VSGPRGERPQAASPRGGHHDARTPLDPPTAMNNATGKRLLALVRGADYAHPGEAAANELLFAGVRPDSRRRILDAGCGGAGTASWVQRRGFGAVTGIEIDAATARLARERHPEVTVVEGDLRRATEVLAGPFALVYSMTAIYAAPAQDDVFRELGALAAPGAELRLLEYADPEGRFSAATSGNTSWGWWRPLAPRDLPEILSAAGWASILVRDLHQEFVHWYSSLCARIAALEDSIVASFGRGWFDFVSAEYSGILELVRSRALGGVLVRARRPG
jgi:SAM-dependent methyltransferase